MLNNKSVKFDEAQTELTSQSCPDNGSDGVTRNSEFNKILTMRLGSNLSKLRESTVFDSEVENYEQSSAILRKLPSRRSSTTDLNLSPSPARKMLERPKSIGRSTLTGNEDPLSMMAKKASTQDFVPKTESLTIRAEDESRIVAAMVNAALNKTSGSVFSVKVDISQTGTLAIGVKDLATNLLAVSMLKRSNGLLGAGEFAGLRLGDIVFGINFVPTREGSKTLLKILKRENERHRKSVYLQCWRCHQLCPDAIPGALFPKANVSLIQAHNLFRTRVFSDWEKWNFIEILLRSGD